MKKISEVISEYLEQMHFVRAADIVALHGLALWADSKYVIMEYTLDRDGNRVINTDKCNVT